MSPVRGTSTLPISRATCGRSFGNRPRAFVRSLGSRPNVEGFGGETETIKAFVVKDIDAAMDSLQITLKDTTTAIDKMWLVERYVLT
jgi:hypothetical protein